MGCSSRSRPTGPASRWTRARSVSAPSFAFPRGSSRSASRSPPASHPSADARARSPLDNPGESRMTTASTSTLGFTHRFVRGTGATAGTTLLLLHGTGGDENDLLPLGEALLPGASMLSPRGKVLEHGMPRFFRRLAEGVFDIEDLKARTRELATFVRDATVAYSLDPARTIAVGFSNGANIAASLHL